MSSSAGLEGTRARLADAAESVAQVAEAVATTLERMARRGDAERRLALGAWHREIARIERQNATALRAVPRGTLLALPPPPRVEGAAWPDR